MIVADLHIHSHFSRATSKDLTLPHLARWAQLKGVQVVGTGDIAHPGWLAEMQEQLQPAEPGLFRLKPDLAAAVAEGVPPSCQGAVRFMLAGEISSIYKKGDKTRKIHNVIFAPSFAAVAAIQARLERIGNIRADGRPILGLPSRHLLEIILEVDERCHLIPAHIWTPWFALLGSKSGYDSVEECFEDLTPHIFALETGLSSDPAMNWRVSNLDRYTLVSNSDAHSPPKLAREATLFETELRYDALFAALRSGDPALFKGTLEFFPEEGKYHHDGHRKCNVNWKPATTLAHHGLCPVCGRPVTVGVSHRVEELADRPEGGRPARVHPFYSLIPLPEILAELHGVGAGSKRVQESYDLLLSRLGPELNILLHMPLPEIAAAGGEKLAAGIGRMRQGQVSTTAGYDGEYGVIRLFDGADQTAESLQMGLFAPAPAPAAGLLEEQTAYAAAPPPPAPAPAAPPRAEPAARSVAAPGLETAIASLNPQQRAAVHCTGQHLIIIAGPGTGKTRTLTVRIAHLLHAHGVAPQAILAITFTNKAAEEMAARLQVLVGPEVAGRITIKTFHAFGAMLLRQYGQGMGLPPDFAILADQERQELLKRLFPERKQGEIDACQVLISSAKNLLLSPGDPLPPAAAPPPADFAALYSAYEQALRGASALDFDDLLLLPVRLLQSQPEVLATLRLRYRWISVDEYQDINHAQYRLLRLLTGPAADDAEPSANLCAIGDPDQAIYGFRGANRSYFLSFAQDFPSALTLHLSQNYRSTQMILDAAAQVIARNPGREAVETWSEFVEQVRLQVYQAPTDRAEAEYVVHQIEQMVGGTSYFSLDSGRVVDDSRHATLGFADFAVLYRLNAQSRPLIEAFERSGIPYQTAGQAPLSAHKGVRAALAYLWLLYNPESHVHRQAAADGGRRLPELRQLWGSQGESTVRDLALRAGEFVQLPEGLLQQLVRRAAPFGRDLPAFLEAMTLGSETDDFDPRADRVALMTLHAAKGLEFPVVFIVGCEQGLLPYLPEGRQVDVEEERRLFYVGMTRAQQQLVLCHARSRFLFGQRLENRPSPFVQDIESALLELRAMERRARTAKTPEAEQLALF